MALELVEQEQPDRERQVALLAVAVNVTNQIRHCHVALAGNLLHARPERLFEADTGLMAADDDRSIVSRWAISCLFLALDMRESLSASSRKAARRFTLAAPLKRRQFWLGGAVPRWLSDNTLPR